MRVVVSGAAGFLGSHLTDLLLGQGDDVVGIDDLSTGRRANIEHLNTHPKFCLVTRDITQTTFGIDGPIDRIYHLASPSTPATYLKKQIATLRVNSQGTLNLLEVATQKGARMLVASTFDVYGDPLVSPQREDYFGNVNSIGLHSAYEEAKRFAETCAMAYNRERGADTRIIRIFNTYGPRMNLDDGRVVTTFVRQALGDQPITVFGDGTQTRTMCHVSDTVRGLTLAMEADFHEPINIGNPDEVSIVQLARNVLELVPTSKSKIVFARGPDYDPRTRRPDI